MYRQTSEGINAVEEFFTDSDLYDGPKKKDETEAEEFPEVIDEPGQIEEEINNERFKKTNY